LERGLAQRPRPGPLAEFDLAHKLRLREGGVLQAGRLGEGAGVAPQRPHEVFELVEHALGEARSHVAGVAELAAVVVAEEEGADAARPPAFAGGEPPDHELLAAMVLHLEPGPRPPAGLVDAVEA